MFTEINLVLSTLGYYHNTYGNWHTINGALKQEFSEGNRTPNFSANLDKKPGMVKLSNTSGFMRIPISWAPLTLTGSSSSEQRRWGESLPHQRYPPPQTDPRAVKVQQTKPPPQRYCTTHTLFSGFSCTRAVSHLSTVQTMAPTKKISSLRWSVLILQGEWVLTVTWPFNTQAYWLCFQIPKDLQTKLMPSLQIWNAVHVPFSYLLLSELQRKTKTHITVLLGQYILQWEQVISKTQHFQHSSLPCQQVGFLSLLE